MTIKNTSGVYRITNTENGKVYYGSSKTLRHRWYQHKSMMRTGTHGNSGIQADAAAYGVEAFEFQVLRYCAPEERKRLEGNYIDQNYGDGCYNDTYGDGTHSEESKAKQAENHARYWEGKPRRKTTCPHCGKVGGANIMPRWHFDNCKQKTPVE